VLLRSPRAVRILMTAVELDLLAPCTPGPASAQQVAAEAGTDPRATGVLLDALTGMRLLIKRGDSYRATEFTARHLSSRAPEPLTGMVLQACHQWRRWSQLSEVVRSGEPARREASQHGARAHYLRAMDEHKGDLRLDSMLPMELGAISTAADLGGGAGTLAVALARAHPQLTVHLVDLPAALQQASRRVPAELWRQRVIPIAADLCSDDPIGGAYDLVVLGAVLHGYGPQTAQQILQRAAAAVAPGGRLVLRELVLEDDGTLPLDAAIFSVSMLINSAAGRAYTYRELAGWMSSAGLVDLQRYAVERGEAIMGHKPAEVEISDPG